MDIARKVIMDLMSRDTRILQTPAPEVFISNLGDSGVELTVRLWTKYSDAYTTKNSLIENIYSTLPRKKVSFPFPQMDVRLVK